MNQAEKIFDTLNGAFCEGHGVPGVEDAFAPGSECARLYAEIYDANLRLCSRLGLEAEEDKDVDTIINNGMAICRILGLKMYEYGLAAQKGPR